MLKSALVKLVLATLATLLATLTVGVVAAGGLLLLSLSFGGLGFVCLFVWVGAFSAILLAACYLAVLLCFALSARARRSAQFFGSLRLELYCNYLVSCGCCLCLVALALVCAVLNWAVY